MTFLVLAQVQSVWEHSQKQQFSSIPQFLIIWESAQEGHIIMCFKGIHSLAHPISGGQ